MSLESECSKFPSSSTFEEDSRMKSPIHVRFSSTQIQPSEVYPNQMLSHSQSYDVNPLPYERLAPQDELTQERPLPRTLYGTLT